jgi:hypothetical protein
MPAEAVEMTAAGWQVLAAERDLQETLRIAALRNGWMAYHTHDSRRSESGFPDLILIRDGRMLVFELKAQKGRVSPQQRAWIAAFDLLPMTIAAVVRPEPKTEGEISFDQALEELAA